MFRAFDYFFTPNDAFQSIKRIASKVTLRDGAGVLIVIAAIGAARMVDANTETTFFLAFLIIALWWNMNSRIAFFPAFVCLALIPVLLTLAHQRILLIGELWTDRIAVMIRKPTNGCVSMHGTGQNRLRLTKVIPIYPLTSLLTHFSPHIHTSPQI